MSKEVDGKSYLSTEEVKDAPEFGYSRDTLYRMRTAGLIKGYRFFGDRRTYWELNELRQATRQPHEIDPKSVALASLLTSRAHA